MKNSKGQWTPNTGEKAIYVSSSTEGLTPINVLKAKLGGALTPGNKTPLPFTYIAQTGSAVFAFLGYSLAVRQ